VGVVNFAARARPECRQGVDARQPGPMLRAARALLEFLAVDGVNRGVLLIEWANDEK